MKADEKEKGGAMDEFKLTKYSCRLVGMVPISDSFGADLVLE